MQNNIALREEMESEVSGNWFCAGTIIKSSSLLVVDYYPNYKNRPDEVQIKFPGGKKKQNTTRFDRNPKDTLFAEIKEEVLLESGKIVSFNPFYKRFESGKIVREDHTKYFSVMQVNGDFRKDPLFEEIEIDETGRSFKEKISPPRFEKVEILAKTIFNGHKPALKVLSEIMAVNNEHFMWALVFLDDQGF